MRILFCVQQVPLPPPDGFRLYIEALASNLIHDHDVRILGFRAATQIDDPDQKLDIRTLPVPRRRSPRWIATTSLSLIRSVVGGRPMKVDTLARRIEGPLREELASFRPDVVHVSTGSLAATGRFIENVPTVLAALDAWHLNVDAWADQARGLRRAILRTEARRVRKFEATDFGLFRRVVVVSEEDRDALHALAPELSIVVIPNGVDVEKFAPRGEPQRRSGRLVFSGVMSYAPNVAAAETLVRDILPRVRRSQPEANVVIVGRRPSARVQALAGADVHVTGAVDTMEPWLSSGSVYVCPMVSGTGIKNKLLEAMANGIPCVVTPLAVQGMDVTPGEELLVGRSEEEIADHVTRVLTDRGFARRLGGSGRRYVSERHGWAAVARAYEGVYRSLLD